jgi:superfamily I DNA and/or RNA helicase
VLFEMQQSEIDLTTVCVLAPYARQVDLLDISTCALYPRTSVQTIDSSQGSTFEYTILFLVRCNEKCDIGFVGDSRRLNVMLSRARRGVLIVGSHRTALGVGRCDGSNLALHMLARMCSYAGVVKPHPQAML